MKQNKITRTYRTTPHDADKADEAAEEAGLPLSVIIDRLVRAWVAGLIVLPEERTEFITPERDNP